MVRAIGDSKGAAWLDPCVGEGAFVRAMASIGVPKSRIAAVDLEPSAARSDRLAGVVRGTDFISWSQGTPARFDRVVANPPYVALNRLDGALLHAALRVRDHRGHPLRFKGNYWSAFLLCAVRVLAPGGCLCVVLPAAWDYADYAEPLRTYLPSRFGRFEVYRCGEPLFGSVQDGCVVLVGRNLGAKRTIASRFELAATNDFIAGLASSGRKGKASADVISLGREPLAERPMRRFDEAFNLKIGAVTGDAHYFLLTDEERRTHELPAGALRPCLTRARHLRQAEATNALWKRLRDAGERVWLFHPPDRLVGHPSVARFIALPTSRGGCNRQRFKVTQREPWYRSELPVQVEGFLSGMSRVGPWICLRESQKLTATNTLYTIRFRLAHTRDQRAAWAMSLFAPEVRAQLLVKGRRYADGLLKYEPGDLHDLLLPVPPRTRGAPKHYQAMVAAFLAHDRTQVDKLTAEWFGALSPGHASVPLFLYTG
jgi:hypothetical protein